MPHKNSQLKFIITNTIDDIPRQQWDGVFGNDIIEGWGYHKALEESQIKEFSLNYLTAEKNNKLIAIAPFFTMDFSFATIIQGRLQKLISKIQRKFPNFLKVKLLFVGLPTAEELYIGIAPGENKETIIGGILRKLYEFCKTNKIKVILFYNLTEEQKELAGLLVANKFCKMDNFPNTRIALGFSSYQEYLDTLSKNTRKDLRRKLNKSSSLLKLETKITDDASGLEEQIFELYMNNFNESDVHFETLTPAFFKNICRRMKGTAKIFLTYSEDKLIAFNLCFIKNGTCIDKFIGFDKRLSHAYHLYQATFNYNINWCIENGLRFYQMGITDYHPKLRLGAKLIPLYAYFKHTNKIANIFSPLIARLIQPTNFDPTLKNLKRKID